MSASTTIRDVDVSCYTCGAKRGEPCHRWGIPLAAPHTWRVKKAEAKRQLMAYHATRTA